MSARVGGDLTMADLIDRAAAAYRVNQHVTLHTAMGHSFVWRVECACGEAWSTDPQETPKENL